MVNCNPQKMLPTTAAHRPGMLPTQFLPTMSSILNLVFLLVRHWNCSWISISSCGKGSGFINSFSSLNILIYNKVFSGEHRARSITRMGRSTMLVTQVSLFPHFIYDRFLSPSLSLRPSLSFSTLGFSFSSDPKQSTFCWLHIKYVVQLIMVRLRQNYFQFIMNRQESKT